MLQYNITHSIYNIIIFGAVWYIFCFKNILWILYSAVNKYLFYCFFFLLFFLFYDDYLVKPWTIAVSFRAIKEWGGTDSGAETRMGEACSLTGTAGETARGVGRGATGQGSQAASSIHTSNRPRGTPQRSSEGCEKQLRSQLGKHFEGERGIGVEGPLPPPHIICMAR